MSIPSLAINRNLVFQNELDALENTVTDLSNFVNTLSGAVEEQQIIEISDRLLDLSNYVDTIAYPSVLENVTLSGSTTLNENPYPGSLLYADAVNELAFIEPIADHRVLTISDQAYTWDNPLRLRTDAVGVGTDNPTTLLDVNGNTRIDGKLAIDISPDSSDYSINNSYYNNEAFLGTFCRLGSVVNPVNGGYDAGPRLEFKRSNYADRFLGLGNSLIGAPDSFADWILDSNASSGFAIRTQYRLGGISQNIVPLLCNYFGSVGINKPSLGASPSFALDVSGDVNATSYTPFTGTHIGYLSPSIPFKEGAVVSTKGEYFKTPNINDSWVKLELSSKKKDASVVGVLSRQAKQYDEDPSSTGPFPERVYRETYTLYNGVGEGQVLCCNEGGNISKGDLLCSSSIPGIAMKQDDDLVHSYTLGKALVSCSFSNSTEEKLVGCVYYCG